MIGWNAQYNSCEHTITRDTFMNANKCSRSIKPYCKHLQWISLGFKNGTKMLKYMGSCYSHFSPESLFPWERQEIWNAACHLKLSFRFTGISVMLLFPDLSHWHCLNGGKEEKDKCRPHLAELTSPDLHGQNSLRSEALPIKRPQDLKKEQNRA